MLVYDGTKADFLRSVEQDTIAYEIEENIGTIEEYTLENIEENSDDLESSR